MTKNNKIAFGILAGSLVGISLFAGGCGTQIAPPPSNVALVDHQVVVSPSDEERTGCHEG